MCGGAARPLCTRNCGFACSYGRTAAELLMRQSSHLLTVLMNTCGGHGLQSSLTKQQRDKVQSFINFVGCSYVAASGLSSVADAGGNS